MTAPDPRLGEIEARLAVATPGPWEVADDPLSEGDWMVRMVEYGPDEPDDVAAVISHESTAEFIANAPTDLAYLLAELRTAREALARVDRVRRDLFEFSEDRGLTAGQCAAYRDASRAINTALRTEG